MTPAYLRQLKYITDRRSWADASRAVGVPSSTLRLFAGGKREPPEAIKNDIRNAYRREAYTKLRDTGFSSTEARRWSTYRPETTQLKTTLLSYKIADLTVGLLGFRAQSQKIVDVKSYIDENYDKVYADIKKGIKRSRRTTEEIIEGDLT